MKELIRNCQHHGHHYTSFLVKEGGEIAFVEKKAFNKDGVADLSREGRGLEWYCRKANKDPADVIDSFAKTEKYCKLVIRYHDGEEVRTPVDPDSVKDKTRIAVEHYLDVFGSDDFKFSHGDYSIENMIYGDNKVVWIIDWEHFNDKLPAGYDAVNCIVESFLFWHGRKKAPTRSSVETAKELLTKVSEKAALPEEVLRSPSLWCRKTALDLDRKSVV